MNCIIAKSLENHESVADDKLSRERRSVLIFFKAPFVTNGLLLWFVSFVWLNKTNWMTKRNQTNHKRRGRRFPEVS